MLFAVAACALSKCCTLPLERQKVNGFELPYEFFIMRIFPYATTLTFNTPRELVLSRRSLLAAASRI